MEVPREYLNGKVIAKDLINEETGELIVECNTEITEEVARDYYWCRYRENRNALHQRIGLWSVYL